MTVPLPISKQYGQQPFYYTNGLRIRNSVVTPLTLIRVGAGTTIDSTGAFQIGSNQDLSCSLLTTGPGGIDSGSVQANAVYGLYLIADPTGNLPTSLLFSFAYGAAVNGPLMPAGYNCYAFIGAVTTDSSSHILPGVWTGNNGSYRTFVYASPILVLNSGTQTTYTEIALSGVAPFFAVGVTNFYYSFHANAAADIINLSDTTNTTGDNFTAIAPVAGTTANSTGLATISTFITATSNGPAIKYKVSAGSLSLYVTGYDFYL